MQHPRRRQRHRAPQSRGLLAGNPQASRGRPGQRRAVAPAPVGEVQERDRLAVKLLPLVKSVARQILDHLPHHAEADDLEAAGVIGLLYAVRKFDARRQVKIETYARHRIRGAILDSLRKIDPVSRDVRQKSKHAEKTYQRLQTALGRAVGDEEMALALGISLREWHRTVRTLNGADISWMRPNRIPEANSTDEAELPASERDNPFELCYGAERRAILNRASAFLPERERVVIALYYGGELTMKEAGLQIGVEECRVSQIHRAAITHLRDSIGRIIPPAASSLM
ncbi:MAG: sigma-70 family RNA polymerase sigma factor [Terriglobia bacterium]